MAGLTHFEEHNGLTVNYFSNKIKSRSLSKEKWEELEELGVVIAQKKLLRVHFLKETPTKIYKIPHMLSIKCFLYIYLT